MANIWNERRRQHSKRKSKKLKVPTVPWTAFPAESLEPDEVIPDGMVVSKASPEDMAKPAISMEEYARILKDRGYTDAMIQNQIDQMPVGWELIDIGEETPEEVAEKVASFYLTDDVDEV